MVESTIDLLSTEQLFLFQSVVVVLYATLHTFQPWQPTTENGSRLSSVEAKPIVSNSRIEAKIQRGAPPAAASASSSKTLLLIALSRSSFFLPPSTKTPQSDCLWSPVAERRLVHHVFDRAVIKKGR